MHDLTDQEMECVECRTRSQRREAAARFDGTAPCRVSESMWLL